MILDQASRKIAHFNAIGIHYEAVYHYVINRRNETQGIYTNDFIDDIVAGLISFDMQRMMGNEKYLRDGDKSWASRLKKALETNKTVLQEFCAYTLTDVDLYSSPIPKKITTLFNDLSKTGTKGLNLASKPPKRRFPVGASKILHFLIPDLFIIVDSNARREIAYFHGIKKNRQLDGDLYVSVMRVYQDELRDWAKTNEDDNFYKLRNLDDSYKRFSGKQTTPLPRIIDKCAFVGSENPDAFTTDYLPKRFELGIGGYFGTSYRAEVSGKSIIYKTFGDEYKLINTQEITPTTKRWEDFWTTVNELNIWKWKHRYECPDVMDGTSWKVSIYYKINKIESSGSNSYPGESDTSPGNQFGSFLNAVQELLGGVPFH